MDRKVTKEQRLVEEGGDLREEDREAGPALPT